MALFTDGLISTIEELLRYESAILDVAKIEGIDLTTKLKLAEEEIAVELHTFLARVNYTTQYGEITTVVPWRPDQIVVTEALHKWHTFRALSITYRDAYNRQLNDRYQGKWQEYDKLAAWAAGALFDSGVGVVYAPVPRAQKPELTVVAGSLPAATYYVAVTWEGAAGAEGAPSELAAITLPAGKSLSVKPVDPPDGATGWNVYAGYSGTDSGRQNDSPLGAAQAWVEPASGLKKGQATGSGQAPDIYLRQAVRRIFDRG